VPDPTMLLMVPAHSPASPIRAAFSTSTGAGTA
jgi:hypothetical protein